MGTLEGAASAVVAGGFSILALLVIVIMSKSQILGKLSTDSMSKPKDRIKWSIISSGALVTLLLLMVAVAFVLQAVGEFDDSVVSGENVVLIVVAAVTLVVVCMAVYAYPSILECSQQLEVTEHGLQSVDAYILDALGICNESVAILCDSSEAFVRGNVVTANFYGKNFVGRSLASCLHENDVEVMNDALSMLFEDQASKQNVEVRVRKPFKNAMSNRSHRAHGNMSASNDMPRDASERDSVSAASMLFKTFDASIKSSPEKKAQQDGSMKSIKSISDPLMDAALAPEPSDDEYFHAELTFQYAMHDLASEPSRSRSRGYTPHKGGKRGYGIVVISRNIDARWRSAKRSMMRVNEGAEQETIRINDAKLRYISCTAHELRTPIQSLSFALDLMANTSMTDEQSDYLQQALVSIDLMTLTVSQVHSYI